MGDLLPRQDNSARFSHEDRSRRGIAKAARPLLHEETGLRIGALRQQASGAMRVLDLKPLAIDLYCGLGGWAEGFLAEGFDVVGFDIERHDYGTGRYPGQLVIQDVLTLHGSQFKDAAVIVASPPCQAYSYRAMPWKKAKALPPPDNTLFEVCFRIQREASEAAGRHIPLIVENVCGAQRWVGRARWHFGSYYLWGDIPALMPIPRSRQKFNPDGTGHPPGSWFAVADSKIRGSRSARGEASPNQPLLGTARIAEETEENSSATKILGQDWSRFAKTGEVSPHWRMEATKNDGGSWFNVAHNTTSGVGENPDGRKIPASCSERRWEDREMKRLRDVPIQRVEESGIKQVTGGPAGWFGEYRQGQGSRNYGSHSAKRKAASAQIAKIPFPLARHIAKCFYPPEQRPLHREATK